jgi:hypothetical protein
VQFLLEIFEFFCRHTLYIYVEGNFFKKNIIFSLGVIGDNILCSELRAGRAGFFKF